ncbi:S8 family peptidase [Rivibacter subsaxonicus]|uniref:Subtilisin family serine protease n=1 Tax=Rivibacter subsaxonicus TaxID=457575 RepID=A0A4Q7W1T7_9BURK|nr:S8 family serine peptidase [Rivibacter subsaxonicus]RZU02815.1 subtilisin family serine protease [Rivibacter subsaxonicus]
MKRALKAILATVAGCVLAACGGGGGEESVDRSASPQATGMREGKTLRAPVAVPGGAITERIDSRLRNARGPVNVWVSLDQPSVARKRADLAELGGSDQLDGRAARTDGNLRQPGMEHRRQIKASQDALAAQLQSMGGKELGRVQMAHNAIAMRVDAARLSEIAALSGVAKVRPVINYELDLSETVPYVGGTAVQAMGFDGTGVRVAVLDSGIDYTHRNLGGAGNAAAYAAAYGANPADPKNTTRDGLFPTAKVVDGYDFVGEDWPNSPEAGDPDPIDFQGHGSHVADIIAGASLDGTHKGMAPGAKLVAVKVCSAVATSCSGVALLQGMDFAIDPNGDGDTSDAVDVINMSLGSSYGQVEDDLTLAAVNAVKLGVVVVVSAGNSADRPYIVGSPSIGEGVISVAQTQVPSAAAYPAKVNAPAAIAGIYSNTATLDFAPIGGGATGDVVAVGLACPGGPALPNLSGKIALIDRGTCSVSLKIDLAAKAGAVGALLALVAPGDAVSFSYGGGDTFVPSLVIQQSLGNAIKSQLTAGQTVNVSISASSAIPLSGSMVGSSSRGPSVSDQRIKPEIGAPGASMSAVAGSGDGEEAFGGTSGAAPMVSGAAALLVQAFPDRSPVKIKAMLMNSAETAVYTNPAVAPGVLAPITRIGAGELRVDRALKLNAAAWNPESSAAALSFGAEEVDKSTVLVKKLRVRNFSNQWREYSVTPSFRYADDEASGAVRVSAPSKVRIAPRGSEDIEVKLRIDPSKLPSWTLNGGSQGGNGALLNGPEFDGYVTLTQGAEKLSVPWHVLPRKASRTDAQIIGLGKLQPTLKFSNKGAEYGDFDVFSLTGTSKKIPNSELPQPGDNFALIDLRAVGVRHLPAAIFGADYLEFAISSTGRRAHPNYPAGFEVDIDTNGDGVPDFAVFNQEQGTFASTGVNLVYVLNLATGGAATAYFYTDADLNSGNRILTVPLGALGVAPGVTLGFTVFAYDNYFTGSTTDVIDGMRFTPGSPRFSVVGGEPYGSVAPGTKPELGLQVATQPDTKSNESGVLVMYRRNAGAEADVLKAR